MNNNQNKNTTKPLHSLKLINGIFRDPQLIGPPYGKLPILFPNPTPIRIPKDMGIAWETLPQVGPIIGGPWNHP